MMIVMEVSDISEATMYSLSHFVQPKKGEKCWLEMVKDVLQVHDLLL